MDLKLSELRAELKSDNQQLAAATDLQLSELRGDVKVIAERTQLGFWGFVWRALVIATLVSLLSAANKFVFNGGLGNLGL
jgi:hypothetical protein